MKLEEICSYHVGWEKVLRIVVYYIRCQKIDFSRFESELTRKFSEFCKTKLAAEMDPEFVTKIDAMNSEVKKEELETAERLLLLLAMKDTQKAMDKGRLTSLMPFWKNGILYTMGRVGEVAMDRILGISKLPILIPK